MRAMSTAALPMRSMELITWSTDAIASASLGCRAASTRHGPHVVHEVGHLVLELVDLLGHVRVAEVERGVGQVDHQLREVLGLGEHGPEVAGFGVHRGAARIRPKRPPAGPHCAPMRRRRLLALLAAAVLGGVGAGVLVERRARAAAADGSPQTTTTPSAPVIQPSAGSADVFTLSSPSFAEGAEIPVRFTCTGDDLSPALSWTGTPLDASSLALVVRDRNAGGFVHWIVTGIDPFVQGVGEGGLPENAVEGRNSAGSTGWIGPCPPAGSGVHNYEFALLALVDPVDLPLDTPAEEAAATLEAAAVERAVLTGTVAAS